MRFATSHLRLSSSPWSTGSRSLAGGAGPGTLMAMPLLLALLLSVALGAPFGEAEARALEVDSGMTVEVSVEVDGGRSAVLARVVAFAGELPPVALVDQGDGRWVGVLRLSGREDVQIAFEAIDAGGSSDISDLLTLTELGVDPAAVSSSRPTSPQADAPGPNWWLVGGVAAGVAALTLVVFWVLAGAGDKADHDAGDHVDADEIPGESNDGIGT